MAGKGSKRRPCDRKRFENNYDQIDWSKETPKEPKLPWDESDIFGATEWEAKHTKCGDCGAPYEVVRPGKIQATCDCEFICKKCGGPIEYHIDPLPAFPSVSGYFCAKCGPFEEGC